MSPKNEEFFVLWDDEAKIELKSIYDHIKYVSEANAREVVNRILATAESLKRMPERYEEYFPMKNLPGNYRFKEVASYILIYDVTDIEVHIVKLAHKRNLKS